MGETVISWTAPNIITVALMMILSGVVVGAATKVIAAKRNA